MTYKKQKGKNRMKKTINENEFINAFETLRPNNFSREGLSAVFAYIVDVEEDAGEELELDVIAICCDFTEYSDLEEIADNYWDMKDLSTDTEKMDWLRDRTQVIEFETGIIIQNF